MYVSHNICIYIYIYYIYIDIASVEVLAKLTELQKVEPKEQRAKACVQFNASSMPDWLSWVGWLVVIE